MGKVPFINHVGCGDIVLSEMTFQVFRSSFCDLLLQYEQERLLIHTLFWNNIAMSDIDSDRRYYLQMVIFIDRNCQIVLPSAQK